MAKKTEKYRQILEADPGSMVFVELARALIDSGEFEQAIETCVQGLDHHPDSIVGHVLWGRALIGLAEPEQAIDQFDKAIALDPDNPYAYNLIGEVLLQRHLYRSALPILRRAVSLQPGDARVRLWLETAERAAGDGATSRIEADATTVQPTLPPAGDSVFDAVAARSGVAAPPDEQATQLSEAWAGDDDERTAMAPDLPGLMEAGLSTDPGLAAMPEGGSWFDALAVTTEGPSAEAAAEPPAGLDPPEDEVTAGGAMPGPEDEDEPTVAASDPALGAPEAAIASDPFEQAFSSSTQEPEDGFLPGLTGHFMALSAEGGDEGLGWQPPADAPSAWEESVPGQVVPGGPGAADPTIFSGPPPLPPPLPKKRPGPPPPPKREAGPTVLFGLDLPPVPTKEASPEEKVVVSSTGEKTAAAIAAEYERELRAKMMPGDSPAPTFFRRYGKWLGVGGAMLLAITTAVVATLYAREATRGEDIRSGLTSARYGLARDSYTSYLAALAALEEVLELEETNLEAKALIAEAEAVVYAELDHAPARKARAERILADARVAAAHPDAALDARYHLADPETRKAVGGEVLAALEARPQSATLHYLAGRHLLATGKADAATRHFESALKIEPGHARTVLQLAGHLASESRWADALQYFDNARENFPGHVRAQLGAAEAKLALGRDLDGAMATVQLIEKEEEGKLAPEERAKLDLVAGRLLAAKGDHPGAVRRLTQALDREPGRLELARTLASLHLARFELDKALAAAERGLRAAPAELELLRLEAQILIDWSRYEDAIERLEATSVKDGRLAWLRGTAAYFAGDLKAARKAFDQTRNEKGRMPTDAGIFLALVELAGGDQRAAKEVLERARKVQKDDPLVRWAVGRLHLAMSSLRPAHQELASLTKQDERLYRALGDRARVELALGWKDQALASAANALEVNGYFREGRLLLGELYLDKGEAEPARDAFARALEHRPKDPDGNRGMALALLGLGRLDEAEQHAQAARQAAGTDARNHHALGRVLLAKESSEAAQVLLRARRLEPDDADILADLGWAYLLRGRSGSRQAKGYFEEALKKDRRHARAQWGLGRALLLAKDKEAARQLKKAAAALGRDADKAAALQDLAEAYLEATGGKPDLRLARQAAWNAVEAQDTAEGRELVARILIDEGKADLARTHLQKALELEPTRATAHFQLGRALAALDQGDAAKASLQRYLELSPKGAQVRDAKKLLATLGS